MFDLIVSNAIIVSAANNYVPYLGSVAVKQGILEYVGERQLSACDGKTVVEAGGDIVMPGLVNGHCHAELAFMRGIGDDMTLLEQKQRFSKVGWFRRYCSEEERYAARQLTYCEAMRSGTTFLNDNMYWSLGTKAVKAMSETGIRGALSEDIRPDFSQPDCFIASEKMREFTDACQKSDIIPVIAGPAEEDYTDRRLEHIKSFCEESDGVPYTCHLAENDWRAALVHDRFGCSSIEYLNRHGLLNSGLIASHVVCATEEDIRLLAQKGVAVVNTPVCEMKIADGIAPIAKMMQEGICVSLGTDGALWNNGNDIFREMKAMLLLQTVRYGIRALSAKDVLNMATVNGAKAFHVENRIGTLEAGKEADFIRISTDGLHMCPLRLGKYENVTSLIVHNVTGNDVRDVYIRGKCVVKDGQVVSINAAKLKKRVKSCSEHISEELSILRNF